MTKRNRPAVDGLITPAHGVSRDGQPLSYNRAPAPDLAPWIGRLYAVKVVAPIDYRLQCGIFSDAAMVHVLLDGEWTAGVGTDSPTLRRDTVFTGPQTRLMPVAITGGFTSVGYIMRPGAVTLLASARMVDTLDCVGTAGAFGSPAVWSLDQFDLNGDPEDWFAIIEGCMRNWLVQHGHTAPDEITERFEVAAFANPSISVAEFAARHGYGERTVERVVRRDFGMSPKQVLRRARALDMASHLRGVADAAEGDELALRYYDQSHLIREFTALFGMSPRQFVAAPLPVLTVGLELRQCHRLAAMARLSPGAARPWE